MSENRHNDIKFLDDSVFYSWIRTHFWFYVHPYPIPEPFLTYPEGLKTRAIAVLPLSCLEKDTWPRSRYFISYCWGKATTTVEATDDLRHPVGHWEMSDDLRHPVGHWEMSDDLRHPVGHWEMSASQRSLPCSCRRTPSHCRQRTLPQRRPPNLDCHRWLASAAPQNSRAAYLSVNSPYDCHQYIIILIRFHTHVRHSSVTYNKLRSVFSSQKKNDVKSYILHSPDGNTVPQYVGYHH